MAEVELLPVLPKIIANEDISDAAATLERYFDASSPKEYYTGGFFERLDGGGDRPGVRNIFTGADIVAVSMLSVDIPPRAVKAVLGMERDLSQLLSEIPWDVDLVNGGHHIGPSSSAAAAWERLTKVEGIAWVTANKLLARKRPRLLPVYDRVVRDEVGRPTSFWASLHASLAADNSALHGKLLAIREKAGVGDDISAIRVFDAVTWLAAQDRDQERSTPAKDEVPPDRP